MTGSSTRRDALRWAAAAPLLAAPAARAATLGVLPHGACLITPQSIEGPYFVDHAMVRTDIAEGRPGVPIELHLRILGTDCRPIPGAHVDLWQADTQGVYSGFAHQGDTDDVSTVGQTYLRGTQFADADGAVMFRSIYPSWYRGRTPHIHAKVWLDQATVLNVQLYMPDALNEFIITEVPAYRRTVQRDTLNATDSFAMATGHTGFVEVSEQAGHYRVSAVLAVDPAARPLPFGRPGFHPNIPGGGRPPGMIGPRPVHDANGRIAATKQLPPEERQRRLLPGA